MKNLRTTMADASKKKQLPSLWDIHNSSYLHWSSLLFFFIHLFRSLSILIFTVCSSCALLHLLLLLVFLVSQHNINSQNINNCTEFFHNFIFFFSFFFCFFFAKQFNDAASRTLVLYWADVCPFIFLLFLWKEEAKKKIYHTSNNILFVVNMWSIKWYFHTNTSRLKKKKTTKKKKSFSQWKRVQRSTKEKINSKPIKRRNVKQLKLLKYAIKIIRWSINAKSIAKTKKKEKEEIELDWYVFTSLRNYSGKSGALISILWRRRKKKPAKKIE